MDRFIYHLKGYSDGTFKKKNETWIYMFFQFLYVCSMVVRLSGNIQLLILDQEGKFVHE